jgi:hypothetical protein
MRGDQELHVKTGESESPGLAEPADLGLAPGLGAGIARGAAVIAGLTILVRPGESGGSYVCELPPSLPEASAL